MFKSAARHIEHITIPHISTRLPLPLPIMPGLVTPLAVPTVMPKRRRALPAVWMRAGTSKGLYLHRQDLPSSVDDWAAVITRVMGSYDSDPKQLNGIGGATSTTSKVAVVSPSKRPGVDVDYTFVQVPIGTPKLDMTGNCGNIASGVGPFAVDEGLVKVQPGETQVSSPSYKTDSPWLTIHFFRSKSEYTTQTRSPSWLRQSKLTKKATLSKTATAHYQD
jgi:hypothetical protein